ncbi:MAG: hypothetical protein M1834_005391 [Cirrosporium novae-zelandiae]|nr:MAG: hypothetical protein M1834_005391 [Cirrosporium novae-zelandiae]
MGGLGDLSPEGSVAIGVLVAVISTSVQSLGLTLQRKSHILEDEKGPYDVRRPPHRRRRWQIGMLMFVVSNLVGSSIQITTLPLPVLSTLQASGLVFNSLFASLILGEPFTKYSASGTLLVCAGATLIAVFGAIGEPAHNLDQLLALFKRWQFIVWAACQGVIVLVVLLGIRALGILGKSLHSPRMRLARGMANGFVSGLLSAHTLLLAKSAVELLVRTIVDQVNQFNRFESWLILLGLITLALTQLYYLHCGLKLVSTSVLYPFIFCIYNVVAILDGLIYFRQMSRLSLLHALLIALGTLILLAGVLALSWRLDDESSTSTNPAVAQSTLAPGLGLVDSPEPSSTSLSPINDLASSDEEAALGGERQPLLGGPPPHPYPRSRKSLPLKPSSSSLLRSTRRRRQSMIEADEIWDELQDTDPQFLLEQPNSHSRRSFSARSGPLPGGGGRSTDALDAYHHPHTRSPLLGDRKGKRSRSYGGRRNSDISSQHTTESENGIGGSRSGLERGGGEWWKLKWWKGGSSLHKPDNNR